MYVCMYVCMYACVYKLHSETQVPLLLFCRSTRSNHTWIHCIQRAQAKTMPSVHTSSQFYIPSGTSMATWIYTPSNQHFKAFLVSKFNSKTSFLYQLFKENLNFIVTEPFKVICKSIFYDFHYYLYLFVSLFMHLYTFISTF